MRRARRAALIVHKDLPLDVTKTIAKTAIATCAAKTYPVSAVVVNRDGDTCRHGRRRSLAAHDGECAAQGLYRDDLQAANRGIRQEVARSDVGGASAGDAVECHRHGGQPIKSGNQIIGGVGVSGSPRVDDECVNAGLEKVKDQLQ